MYRFATEDDLAQVQRLWRQDFEQHEPYYSWYFAKAYRPERTLCDFEGAALAANLQLAPYQLQLRGARLDIAYYVGVITDTAFRGQGRGHALLRHTEQYLGGQGLAAALFYTDIPGYYAPLGYRHCYRQQVLHLTGTRLSDWAATADGADWQEGDWRRDWPLCDAVYRRMTHTCYQGYIARTPADWAYYLGEQNCEGARLRVWPEQAYLVAVREGETLHVYEAACAACALWPRLLAEMARLAREWGAAALRWDAPADLPGLLPQVARDCWRERPFVMARLLDWPAVLTACAYAPELDLLLDLTVVRQQRERRLLRLAGGRAQVAAAAGLEADCRVCLPVGALTRLVFGDPDWPKDAPELTQAERACLQQCWPPLNRWINEYT